MTRIGITGHQKMPRSAIDHARRGIDNLFNRIHEPLIGVSSLAAGADQLFAEEVLKYNGILWVVVPSASYESTFSEDELISYKRFVSTAAKVARLEFDRPSETAYYAAGKWIVDNCDELVAIWDGLPARGLGGTGDIVAYATSVGRSVHVLWPLGAVR